MHGDSIELLRLPTPAGEPPSLKTSPLLAPDRLSDAAAGFAPMTHKVVGAFFTLEAL